MNQVTVWDIVKYGYSQWYPKVLNGFGIFNLKRKSNKGTTGYFCLFINLIIMVIGTPWILVHYIAAANMNARPQSVANKIGYWIATIIALIMDAACIGAAVFVYWTSRNDSTIVRIFSAVVLIAPLMWAGLSKLPFLFMKVADDTPAIPQYEEQEEIEDCDYEEQEEVEQEEEIVEELPFCQIFRLNETEDLHIVRVEYCPDETAFIRVVSEESYTKEYKRKVQIDEAENRFIEFNDKKYYLKCSGDDEVIDIDKMDGATFEHFCADLLRVNGWTDVQITPASGDHGIDITAEKDDIKWGFQCKRWNGTKVDAIAIGQTYKGKALYECDIVAIITTSSFTRQAEDEARQLGIKLWRRAKIRQLMSKLENAEDYYLSA